MLEDLPEAGRDESNTGGNLEPGAIAGIAFGAAAVAIIAAIATT